MAYVPTDPEDDERQSGLLDPDQPAQPVLGQQGATLDPSTSASEPAGGSPASDGGGGQFDSIQKFIASNRPASQRLADRVGTEITNRGNAARQAITAGGQGFEQDVAGREVRQDAGLLNRIAADPA